MAYHFHLDESIPESVRRIACEQIDGAMQQLANQQHAREDRVHQARKHFKKLRGLLRLVRPVLGNTVYRRENTFFRDAGRAFARVRDSEAVLETCDTFQEEIAHHLGDEGFDAFRLALLQRQQELVEQQIDLDAAMARVLEDLHAARDRVETWPLQSTNFGALAAGLQRTYKRGQKEYGRAYAKPTSEHFHEWRKRVKYHWYHVRLLEYVWAEVMGGRRQTIKYLADLLGDDHDLAVLDQTVQQQTEIVESEHEIELLREAIEQKQAHLRTAAWHMGQRVFAEKPKPLAQRIYRYWNAWQTQRQPAVTG